MEKTLTLLGEGARCSVVGQEGSFVKVAVDTDLEGYVSSEYIETEVEFKGSCFFGGRKAQAEEKAQAQKEADAAIQALEEAKTGRSPHSLLLLLKWFRDPDY